MNDLDRFERAIETLLADRSPKSVMVGLSAEEQRMVQMAQMLRGSHGQTMDPAFAERLRGRLVAPRRVTRRTAAFSGLGALAAGVIAALGLNRALLQGPSTPAEQLVGANGRWYPVATLADLPDGAIQPFTAGAVQGFLIYRHGQVRALSRICTHMGCTLRVDRAEQTLQCPCHGAEFDLKGQIHNPQRYGRTLPPLPAIRTRVRGETVEVFGV
jgi:nitrite reductase/ring-hydroxylating ferredoxin subunit